MHSLANSSGSVLKGEGKPFLFPSKAIYPLLLQAQLFLPGPIQAIGALRGKEVLHREKVPTPSGTKRPDREGKYERKNSTGRAEH